MSSPSPQRQVGRSATVPLVEILYFRGCPNHEPAAALVERLARELDLEPRVRLVEVGDVEAAQIMRFLGSPTIRVNGRDVDPHASARNDYSLSCRVFNTQAGLSGLPDERWIAEALLGPPNGQAVVARALLATGIPLERQGRDRLRRLTEAERDLYRWILRRFGEGEAPLPEEVRARSAVLGLDFDAVVAVLAQEDLVHVDESGEIVVAYPFSGRPRGHHVSIEGGPHLEAMCAIDALGIAPMMSKRIDVQSSDPVTGTAVHISADSAGITACEPASAVVLAGSACDPGPSFRGCCDVLHFFASRQSAEQYSRRHRVIAGFPISLEEAFEVGRAVFGGILD